MPDVSLDIQPNFAFAAPELLMEDSLSVDSSADIFSLGMLTLALYNHGKTPYSFTSSHLCNPSKFVNELKSKLSSNSCFSSIPEVSRNHIKLMLSFNPTLRPDAQQISKLNLFQDALLSKLKYFDSPFQWDNAQKVQFYKDLPDIIPKLPQRVKLRRIMMGLSNECVNPQMVPLVLPTLLAIARDTNDDDFDTWIVPVFLPIFKYTEPRIHICLLQNMDFLITKFKKSDQPDLFRQNIIALIHAVMDASMEINELNRIRIELALQVIPSLIHLIEFNKILPRMKQLISSNILSLKVNCLVCLGKIVNNNQNLDRWFVDEILTLVMQSQANHEPAVIMACIGILKIIFNNDKLGITKEILATKVIPFLVPFSIEKRLSLQQYNTVMLLIREMLNKVEELHHGKLTANTESNGQSLSLYDKERIVFQKEQNLERLNNEKTLVLEPKITPVVNSDNIISQQTKDLTSTLMNTHQNLFSTNSNISNSLFHSSNLNSITNSSLNSKNKSDCPALDNLFIHDISKKNLQSLNAMKNSNVNSYKSVLMPTNFNNSQPSKQLSQSELEEFLN